ncbi:hypothetical protein VP01_1714g1 [Puccinia sorghi]|uniref:Uncharacterized protein n=1 Tax=Puccinia sorghi TaxID=27349 RepID=A0A0L6VFE9_9BASI|nr:hypothetical protein VP01_1714g1 [Puccinia sorghi]
MYSKLKVYLNSKPFANVYLSPKFQQRLSLVVDEAHMSYSWGLVESGKE